jgi:hypothetical protein
MPTVTRRRVANSTIFTVRGSAEWKSREQGVGSRENKLVIPARFWRESSDFALSIANQGQKALDSRFRGNDEQEQCPWIPAKSMRE